MRSRPIIVGIASIAGMLAVETAGVLAAPATLPTTRATVEEASLGTISGFDAPLRNIAMDFDANHVAFVGTKDRQQFVVLDGKSSLPFDQVVSKSLEFSPLGLHLGYLIQTATDTVPVIDFQMAKGYYSIAHDRIFWSPSGKRNAFAAQFQDGTGAVVVDGVAGPKYDGADFPIFSPDSNRLAYIGKRGKQQFIVVDGKEDKAYDAVGRTTFSPNSKHLTYQGVVNGKAMLVLDGQEGKPYDAIKIGPVFSSDEARVVAVAAQGGKLVVVVNGRESPPYEALLVGDYVLSPDGKHIAYAVKQENQQMVVVDNVPQTPFDHIGANSLSFSPDSKRVAYQAGDAGKGHDFVVVDGVKGKHYDGILTGTPFFSPDSRRIAYGALHDGNWQYVVDGVEGKPYKKIESPSTQLFSPDSKRFAYRVLSGETPRIVIDGVESPPAEAIGFLAFSPDSKHIAFLRVREEKTWLVIDGTEVAGPYNPMSPRDVPVIFDDAGTAHLIATRKDEFLRVKVKIGQ